MVFAYPEKYIHFIICYPVHYDIPASLTTGKMEDKRTGLVELV